MKEELCVINHSILRNKLIILFNMKLIFVNCNKLCDIDEW